MELIAGYLLFAVTTGLCALYELFYPVVSAIKVYNANGLISNASKMTLLVLTFSAILFAPVFIPLCIIPRFGEIFRNRLQIILEKD